MGALIRLLCKLVSICSLLVLINNVTIFTRNTARLHFHSDINKISNVFSETNVSRTLSCRHDCITTFEYVTLDKEHGYEYQNDVDIRIIVMTHKRAISLKQCLESISRLVIKSNETAALEIWIDKPKESSINKEVIKVATNFTWKSGETHVHVHQDHVGLYSQWIDTWRPKKGSSEIVLFVEDDVDISPYTYTFLRKAFVTYHHVHDIAMFCIQDENVINAGRGGMLKVPSSESVYLYRVTGSWGCAPHPDHWTKFRYWYHVIKHNTTFQPYVSEAKVNTGWYKAFERRKAESSMWTMWFIYFMHSNNLYCLYSNIPKYLKQKGSVSANRREAGLHFRRNIHYKPPPLLSFWNDSKIIFPENLKRYSFQGQLVGPK